MKKLIIGGLIVAAIVLAYFVGFHPSTQSALNDATISSIEQEAAALKAELSALSSSVDNDTLSPDAAVAAHGRIQTKLASIEQTYRSANTISMSKDQRDAMIDSLSTIKDVLLRYQSTLVAVDTAAARKMGKAFPGSITSRFLEVVVVADASVDEALPEYEASDVELDVETEVFLNEVEMGDITEVDTTLEIEGEVVADPESTDTDLEAQVDTDMSGTFDADNMEDMPAVDDEEVIAQ